ncbi:hypothetical protein LshimejAT787_1700670 [Lyophyllum shimeji]|uniref:Uncharacterized protein n=1 Tax=Lyophyllum shimeji TaxID=47721 RepID=A0A9P3UU76_LYOSH|nr:hypothetical protein LshimejAT787_1700670 [Lyophyllum shimeji]
MASTSETSRIDDRDPRIVYTGNWEAAGDPEHEFDGTSHGTRSNGAQALFTFVGSAVSVYGTIEKGTLGAAGAPTSSYTIDGSAVGRFTGTPKSDTVFRQPFFVSGTLPAAGNHTLGAFSSTHIPVVK